MAKGQWPMANGLVWFGLRPNQTMYVSPGTGERLRQMLFNRPIEKANVSKEDPP